MREMLFRGKQVGNGKWVLGYYYKAKHYRSDTELCDYIAIPHSNIPNEPSDHIMVVPETVGQYTGLTDKRGRKIFEGDILSARITQLSQYRFEKENAVVYFDDEEHNWSVKFSNGNKCRLWTYATSDFYLIGNIHDNPELLK